MEATIASTTRTYPSLINRSKRHEDFTMPRSLKLWIDGVGTYLVLTQDKLTIGAERWDGQLADVRMQAGIRREHALIEREGEDYWLTPLGTTRLNDREIQERSLLQDNYLIALDPGVQLRFSLPSSLSSSARLDFVSDHRPAERIDGIVLMSETCLLGRGPENHIHCRNWGADLVLFQRDAELFARCRSSWSINSVPVEGAARLEPESLVTGPDFRFRLEQFET